MSDLTHEIERLVDGELPEERRRKLLGELNRSNINPGWRQLALAYVEAQTMSEALRGLMESPAEEIAVKQPATGPAKTGPAKTGPAKTGPSYLTFWAAVAASFLIALAVGLSIRGEGPPIAEEPSNESAPVAQKPAAQKPAAEMPKQPTPAPQEQPPALVAQNRNTPNYGQATLLVSDSDGSRRRVQLPVVYAQDDRPLRQLSRQTAVPPQVVEALQRMGYEVEQRRSVMHREFEDGRQMFVPIDQVNVNYVGGPAYQ